MNKVVSSILKNIFLLFFLVLIFYAVKWKTTAGVNDFCGRIEQSFIIEDVVYLSKQKGYKYFLTSSKNREDISVITQDSPFFRFACVVSFHQGVFLEKKVIAYD